MKFFGGRLREWEKEKGANLSNWIKSKTERQILIHWWAQDG